MARQGPLVGLKIIEFAGIGPAPFCGMLMSDLGADVIRIDRKNGKVGGASGALNGGPFAVTERGRRSIALDLKKPEAVETCLRLIAEADGVIEGFRPGVMERLGLGPDEALARHPRLVYGRMTGWGQYGPLARSAGHDINYIAISGALGAIGTQEKPISPLNLVGDFGGGALYLAFGLLAAIVHARETGVGQVVDCAMSDGTASLMSLFYGFRAMGIWSDQRRSNILDGGAHFYDTYRCLDGKWVAIGSIEPAFYALLCEKAGVDDPGFENQMEASGWGDLSEKLSRIFETKTQAEWGEIMAGTDVCFAPVLDMSEAPFHPHNVARGTFVELDGVVQPAPAPRFSITPGKIQRPAPKIGADNVRALRDWGLSPAEIASLEQSGAL